MNRRKSKGEQTTLFTMANEEEKRSSPGTTEEDLQIFETLCISSPRKVFKNKNKQPNFNKRQTTTHDPFHALLYTLVRKYLTRSLNRSHLLFVFFFCMSNQVEKKGTKSNCHDRKFSTNDSPYTVLLSTNANDNSTASTLLKYLKKNIITMDAMKKTINHLKEKKKI